MQRIVISLLCLAASVYGQSWIGGSEAPDGRYPYIAALRLKGEFMCGASILNERWLLTAGHCVDPIKRKSDVTIVVGTNFWSGDGGVIYKITKTIQHPDYDKNIVHINDIALFQIDGNITFTTKIQPMRLATDDSKDYAGSTVILAGWGKFSDDEEAPSRLQHVKLKVVSNAVCHKEWRTRDRDIKKTQVCTVGSVEKSMSTHGDSGGPLVLDGVQIGVVSFSWDKLPDVYTRVSSYLSWINKYVST